MAKQEWPRVDRFFSDFWNQNGQSCSDYSRETEYYVRSTDLYIGSKFLKQEAGLMNM